MNTRALWNPCRLAGGLCLLVGILSAQVVDEGPASVEDLIALHSQVANDAQAEQDSTEPVSSERPTILRENLVNNSPFRAVRRGRGVVMSNQPLELRGFIGRGENMEVSLTDPRTKECQWVRVRDPNARWYVESANSYTRSAVVQMDGISITLEMSKPSEIPITTASQHAPQPAPAVVATPSQPQQQGRPQVQVRQQGQQGQQQQRIQRPQGGRSAQQSTQRR